MSGVREITLEMEGARDLALIANNDSVWLVVPLRWWDLSTFLWWFFMPWDKKARVKLSLTENKHVSCYAVRVASKHVRIRGFGG